jgi:hypothetical protein
MWKQAFDKDAEDRKAGGSEGGQLFRDDSHPNLVFILFKWDLAKAREYGHLNTHKGDARGWGDRATPHFLHGRGRAALQLIGVAGDT